MLVRLLCVLMLLYVVVPARADLIVYESFDYPGTDANGRGLPIVQLAGTGTGFVSGSKWNVGGRSAFSSNWSTTTGSLAYPGLSVANNSVEALASSAIQGAYRDTAAAFLRGPSSVNYLSFLIRWTDAAGALGGFGGIYIDGGVSDNADNKLFIGRSGVSPNWVIENVGGAGQVDSGAASVLDQTALLVLKMEGLEGNDRFTLFANPTSSVEPLSGAVKTDLDVGTASRLVMYHTGGYQIDEIRIGTTFADVTPMVAAVPEPSTFALACVAFLLPAGRRFFRRRTA